MLPNGEPAATAQALRRAAADLAGRAALIRICEGRLDTVLAALFGEHGPWQGPSAGEHHDACVRHRHAMAQLPGPLDRMVAVIADLAAEAVLVADELAAAERARATAAALPDPVARDVAESRADTRPAELAARWRRRATQAAEELDAIAAEPSPLSEHAVAEPGSRPSGAVLDLGSLARYAALAGMPPDAITPSGALGHFVADRLAAVDATPLGAMHFDVIETINDRGDLHGDGYVSDGDLDVALGDRERLVGGVRRWADRHGFEFDDATVAHLVDDIAATAAAMRLSGRTGVRERRPPTTSEAQRAALLAEVAGLPGGVAVAVLGISGDPAVTASWWQQAPAAERAAATAGQWRLVGNLDGLPAAVRDRVNRQQLDRDMVELGRRSASRAATEQERRAHLVAIETHVVLAEMAALDDPHGGEVAVQLYAYDPHRFGGDGAVALVLGDLDDAAHVAFSVSGLGSDASRLAADRTAALYDEARWAADGETVAIVHWQGYDAPSFSVTASPLDVRANGIGATLDELGDLVSVVNRGRAEAGAVLLAKAVDGVRSMRVEQPRLTVVANSYGSTTALLAADHHDLAADALVVTGSPGAGDAVDVTALSLPAEAVYVLSASTDLVSYFGQTGGADPVSALVDLVGRVADVELLGRDPAAAEFGAVRLAAEHPERRLDAALVLGDVVEVAIGADLDGHDHYYDRGSESLYNIAAVIAGRDDLLRPAGGRTGEHAVIVSSPVRLGLDPGDVSFGWHLLWQPWRPAAELMSDWRAGFVEIGLPLDPERSRDVALAQLTHEPASSFVPAAAPG